MGILDDAIRQHLELKRRAGADPSAVAKLEHEAFGPIEREDALGVPEPSPVAQAAHEVALEEEHAYEAAEHEADDEWAAGHPTASAAVEPEPAVEPEAAEPEPPRMAYEPAPVVEEAPATGGSARFEPDGEQTVQLSALEPEPRAAPLPPEEPPVPARRVRAEPEPAAEADPQPDAEPGEHDELEETPEFLQETPEHDRLWFEQKPPRDFDF